MRLGTNYFSAREELDSLVDKVLFTGCIDAVSYTHLIPYSIKNIGNTILERLKKGKPYSIVVVAEGIRTDGRKPVSYTHLDVYKRQSLSIL